MATGFFYHPDFLLHDTGPGHPERKERLTAIIQKLQKEKMLENLSQPRFGPASLEDLSRVHDMDYLKFLAQTEKKDSFALDPDTAGCNQSWPPERPLKPWKRCTREI